jgi:UDP-glucose 4-epimerase
MRVLITGGAGFIGSHLTAAFLDDGADVVVLDDLSTGSETNLIGMSPELIVGDIADLQVVERAVAGCDLVVHLAALVSAPYSLEDPLLTFKSNVTGTFNLLEAARLARVLRFVYASSSAVYGNLPGLPKMEGDTLAPITPYAATKQVSEVMAGTYAAAYGLETVGLRFMNVFGPRQDPSSPYSGVLSIFCQATIAGEGCTIYGDGEQTRDFVYVGDVVRAITLAAGVPAQQLPDGAVFNVGRGEQTSLNQIVDMLEELSGQSLEITYAAERTGDIKHSVADIGLARDALGFQPQTPLFDGLQATLDWFRDQERV